MCLMINDSNQVSTQDQNNAFNAIPGLSCKEDSTEVIEDSGEVANFLKKIDLDDAVEEEKEMQVFSFEVAPGHLEKLQKRFDIP